MFQRFALAVVGLTLMVLIASAFGSFARPTGQQASPQVFPSPLTEPFDVWVSLTHENKIIFYSGWANGMFTNARDPGTLSLGNCLQKLTFDQIVAMIDKWHADHREKYKNPMGTEIIEAVTAPGASCEGIRVAN